MKSNFSLESLDSVLAGNEAFRAEHHLEPIAQATGMIAIPISEAVTRYEEKQRAHTMSSELAQGVYQGFNNQMDHAHHSPTT